MATESYFAERHYITNVLILAAIELTQDKLTQFKFANLFHKSKKEHFKVKQQR